MDTGKLYNQHDKLRWDVTCDGSKVLNLLPHL